jgi:exportin-2 (importin alpha re-exporter)
MAGYQAAYSRLASSEIAESDPVAYVEDVQEYLSQGVIRSGKADPRIKACLQAMDINIARPFLQSLP